MLSGNNSILQKATDAKEQTGIGQEKEIVALAYNSALVKKVSNGDSTAVTASNMNTELSNQGAKADGSDPIKVTFTSSKRQYTINSNGEIEYAGIKGDEDNNSIQLSITAQETESRAIILRVKAKSTGEDNTLTESKLRELEENNLEQVQNYFVQAYRTFCEENGAPESFLNELSWNYLVTMYTNAGGTGDSTIHEIYNKFLTTAGFSSAYDFIIKNTGAINATFTCTENESITGKSAEFIVTKPNPTITATISDEGGYIEKVWDGYPDAKKEIYSEIQNSNYTLIQDDYTAIIPAGFAYGTSANVGTISNGLVITDAVENGYSIGNEFVWIPVDKTSLKVVGTEKIMAIKTSGIDDNGKDNYEGKFYEFPGTAGGIGSRRN